jgi:hypothetical protein
MTCIPILDAGAENEWLGMMSSRVNISQVHVHFGIIREHTGRREKKFPGDLQALSTCHCLSLH